MRTSEAVAAQRRDWEPSVERDIFGDGGPAAALESWCERRLGSPVEDCLFYTCYVGAVAGFRLLDGRAVVVKAHQPDRAVGFLEAVSRVQAHLWAAGFPCPRPLAGPSVLTRGWATAEELLLEGDYRDAHQPEVRRAMAEALARLVELTAGASATEGLTRSLLSQRQGLWPRPHHPTFDFEATTAGAGWIDGHARRALASLREHPSDPVVGHTDWSAKHFRFSGSRIVAVYDWDSLAWETEAVVVGSAAATFTMTWAIPVRVCPSPVERSSFVEEYEAARGRRFTPGERRAISATVLYATAYTARCEYSRDRPADGEYPPGSALEALVAFGDRLLAT